MSESKGVHLPAGPVDVRLVACDMDGTLLDAQGRVPAAMWPLVARMEAAGIVFAPASGRQYATLERLFAPSGPNTVHIAENGTYVVRDGVELSSTTVGGAVAADVVPWVRRAAVARDVGVVVCGKKSAYIERTDPAFVAWVGMYYAQLQQVPDVLVVDEVASGDILKVSVHDAGDAEHEVAPKLARIARGRQIVVADAHWIDIMAPGVSKGKALRALQTHLGVSADQTVAFGDYLNDVEMLEAAGISVAMANAHPRVRAGARYRTSSNTDGGVVTALTHLLDRSAAT